MQKADFDGIATASLCPAIRPRLAKPLCSMARDADGGVLAGLCFDSFKNADPAVLANRFAL
jgi:hypothetical protein